MFYLSYLELYIYTIYYIYLCVCIYIYIYTYIYIYASERNHYNISVKFMICGWFQATNSIKCTNFWKNMKSIMSTRKNCNNQTKRKLFFRGIFFVYSFKLGSIFFDLKLVKINILFHLHKLCKLSKRKHILMSHTRKNTKRWTSEAFDESF